jgi:hypothetical protein
MTRQCLQRTPWRRGGHAGAVRDGPGTAPERPRNGHTASVNEALEGQDEWERAIWVTSPR